jgi:phenylalanine-4-hydroxylase
MPRYTSTKYTAKIPNSDGLINYTRQEHGIWSDLFKQQKSQVNKYMSNIYNQGMYQINLSAQKIPQCKEISNTLYELTQWVVEPVPALIGFKRFFNMLANKRFPAASFIRTREDFGYVKEPDIFHEIFGHTPLLTNQKIADFSQKIGLVGQNANPKDHSWLARLYWFTIEFGLIKENNACVPYGSGLASSPTELEYAATCNVPYKAPFDISTVLRTPYRIDIKQPIYFVLESLDQLAEISGADLLSEIHQAQKIGLNKPLHPIAKAI